MYAANFWDAPQAAAKTSAEAARLQKELDRGENLKIELNDLGELGELALTEKDTDELAEVTDGLIKLTEQAESLTAQTLLSGEYDDEDAIVEIHPGAGGTDSADWAEMLYRMYYRFCEQRGWKVELIELTPDDIAGIKSATLAVRGELVYGYLKSEIGVHRLVRLSPFDSSHKRHTSFAALYAYPDLSSDIEVEIVPADLRIDVFRASGHGGQSVNTTDSAVRITHKPTGIVVSCQNERSQHANKNIAMKVLKSRLADLYRRQREEELAKSKADKSHIGFGAQIRNYVLHPYQLVKDARTAQETGNIQAVLDGDLDQFIEAYLRWSHKQ